MMRNSPVYKRARMRTAYNAVISLAKSGVPVSSRSVQTKMQGAQRVSPTVLSILIKRVEKHLRQPVLVGSKALQPKKLVQFNIKKNVAREYLLTMALFKKPVSPTMLKRDCNLGLPMAKRLFDEIVHDPKFIKEVKEKEGVLIRTPPVVKKKV